MTDELARDVERVRALSRRLHTSVQSALARHFADKADLFSPEKVRLGASMLTALLKGSAGAQFTVTQRAVLMHASGFLSELIDHTLYWSRQPNEWEPAPDPQQVRERCREAIPALERLCEQVEMPTVVGSLEPYPLWLARPAREPRRVQPGEWLLRAERRPSEPDAATTMTYGCVHGHPVEPSHCFARIDDARRRGPVEVLLGKEDGPALHLLMNASRAVVCFSEKPDIRPWLAAVDPDAGTKVEEFEHENGEHAEFAAHMTISVTQALEALRYLYEHAEPDPALRWEI
jgi:hypothetical protein